MSSLLRYKKSGGFNQLLSLIETFGPQKREKFMVMIEAENSSWAKALRDKMLSLERIFSWNDDVVNEIYKRLPVKQQAFALNGLKEEYKAKLTKYMSQSDQRRLSDVMDESKPKPEELQAAVLKMVEITRQLIKDREIMPDRFDPGLTIPEDFENKIDALYFGASSPSYSSSSSASAAAPESAALNSDAAAPAPAAPVGASGQSGADVYQLQRSLNQVIKENKQLKDEVRVLRDKLDQIKKIA